MSGHSRPAMIRSSQMCSPRQGGKPGFQRKRMGKRERLHPPAHALSYQRNYLITNVSSFANCWCVCASSHGAQQLPHKNTESKKKADMLSSALQATPAINQCTAGRKAALLEEGKGKGRKIPAHSCDYTKFSGFEGARAALALAARTTEDPCEARIRTTEARTRRQRGWARSPSGVLSRCISFASRSCIHVRVSRCD